MQPDKGARKIIFVIKLAKDETYCNLFVVENNLVHKIVKLYIYKVSILNALSLKSYILALV